MRILISSHKFYPSVGGIETVSLLLAEAFSAAGHEVRVITQTPASGGDTFPFEVYRAPSLRRLWEQIDWCDVYLQNNISLATLWPALLLARPVVVVHQTWIARPSGRREWQDYIKLAATFLVRRNFACSRALARSIPARCGILPNPYLDNIFVYDAASTRNRGIVFVGRLVSDKGCGVLLRALGKLTEKSIRPLVTIVGSGPELKNLKETAAEAGVLEQIDFSGEKTGGELARLLNQHRIMVVPSLWNEPFGIVALEGIACGCVVVGSGGGGLPDAIGPCGKTFPNGDSDALADILESLLVSPRHIETMTKNRDIHLNHHSLKEIGNRYLSILKAINSGR